MNTYINEAEKSPIFLVKSALVITAVATILLTPFSINNFIQGRTLLGLGSLVVIILCAINTWNCARDRYRPLFILLSLAPFIIIFLIFAFRELGIIGALWCYPAALSFYFILPERYAWVANTVLFVLVLPEAWDVFEHPVAFRFAATLLSSSIFAGVFIRFITRQQIKLEEMAITDLLTGLFNRRRLQHDLEKALQQNHRMGAPMTLLMFDLDNLKTINDTFGHLVGDDVLRGIGVYFQNRTRSTDTVFRTGGDEFLALLYDTNINNACHVAEEISKEITLLPLLQDQPVTVSIGIADLKPDDDLNSWLKRVDRNLYMAKSSGRNQVVA
jgi:diguanylate cyclase (GGDEF)-like protein